MKNSKQVATMYMTVALWCTRIMVSPLKTNAFSLSNHSINRFSSSSCLLRHATNDEENTIDKNKISNNPFDVIIVGGSYAGLSAALALGRALRHVLIIDSGNPCNKQTPHSHNFLTQDGKTPQDIFNQAKKDVLQYPTITFYNGFAVQGTKTENGFEITTENDKTFASKKLLFTTGVIDEMPETIKGFKECWGISILHCPYCHGYEVHHQQLGVMGNGDVGYELCKLISQWTDQLTLFTNGKSTLTEEQTDKINSHNIKIIEDEISEFVHDSNGQIQSIKFVDKTIEEYKIDAIFARVGMKQHSEIPSTQLGCEVTDMGHIKVDDFKKTNIPGIYAAGDSTTMFRTLSMAISSGTLAGAIINMELINETF